MATLVPQEKKPEDCRLSDEMWRKYLWECQRGRLFFTSGHGLIAWINNLYQGALLGHPKLEKRATHVGIIGDERFAYEALPTRGLTRDFCIDRYTCGRRILMIGELIASPTEGEIHAGIKALLRYMRTRRNGYDWLSLFSLGLAQSNGRVICSEAARNYVNAVLRFHPSYEPCEDKLALPEEFIPLVNMKFIG